MNPLKKGEVVHGIFADGGAECPRKKKKLLNFEGGPGILLLYFEGGPGVRVLNFRGVSGPTFKVWGGSRVPSSRVPGSWSHFYSMPVIFLFRDKVSSQWISHYCWIFIDALKLISISSQSFNEVCNLRVLIALYLVLYLVLRCLSSSSAL